MGEFFPRRTSGGVVRRKAKAAAAAAAAAGGGWGSGPSRTRRREVDSGGGASREGFAHVDKQRRIQGILPDSRCTSESATKEIYFCSDSREFKHKRSTGNPTMPFVGKEMRNEMEIRHTSPSVMAKLIGRGAPAPSEKGRSQRMSASGYPQKSYFLDPRADYVCSDENLLHVSSSQHKGFGKPFDVPESSKVAKECHKVVSSNDLFRIYANKKAYCMLKRNVENSGSMQRDVISASRKPTISSAHNHLFAGHNGSLSQAMSKLRHLGRRHSCRHQNRTLFFNPEHGKAQFGETTDISRKSESLTFLCCGDEEQTLPKISEGRYWQTLLDNAVIRGDKLKCSRTIDHEIAKQIWSSANSGSGNVGNLALNESMDELQVLTTTVIGDYEDSYMWSMVCSAESSSSTMAKEDLNWTKTSQTVYFPYLAEQVDIMFMPESKEAEQPSPVSVLQPPTEESSCSGYLKRDIADPYELQLQLELVNFPTVETIDEESGIEQIGDCFSAENEAIQLVEDIQEEFGDEEERDFSYLLDTLIASGIHGADRGRLCKVCHSLNCPAGPDVFEKLEKKYDSLAQWSRSERKLLFDMVNSILSDILAPCLDLQPWVNTSRKVGPMWGSEGLVEKVSQMLTRRREELALGRPEAKAFDQKWPDLADGIDMAGRKIEKMIKDDLLEELVSELLFG